MLDLDDCSYTNVYDLGFERDFLQITNGIGSTSDINLVLCTVYDTVLTCTPKSLYLGWCAPWYQQKVFKIISIKDISSSSKFEFNIFMFLSEFIDFNLIASVYGKVNI